MMEAQILTLKQAIFLYDTLKDHLPPIKDDAVDLLDFIGKIVSNIRMSGRHNDYMVAISLLTGLQFIEIINYKSEDILRAFIDGLVKNRILDLIKFFKQINYA